MRVLGLLRADADSEAGVPPDPDLISRMGDLMQEITNAGVMLATDGLHPSSKGKRVSVRDGKLSVIDGPFTESKELVASYAVFQVKDWDEAIYWSKKFLDVLGTGDLELRPIFEPEDFSEEVFTPEERAREAAIREQMEKNVPAS